MKLRPHLPVNLSNQHKVACTKFKYSTELYYLHEIIIFYQWNFYDLSLKWPIKINIII